MPKEMEKGNTHTARSKMVKSSKIALKPLIINQPFVRSFIYFMHSKVHTVDASVKPFTQFNVT